MKRLSAVFFVVVSLFLSPLALSATETVSVNLKWNAYYFGDEIRGFKLVLGEKDKEGVKEIVLKKGEYNWDFANYTLEGLTPDSNYYVSLIVLTKESEDMVDKNVCFTSPRPGYTKAINLNSFGRTLPIDNTPSKTVEAEVAWEHVNKKMDNYLVYVLDKSGNRVAYEPDTVTLKHGLLVYNIENLEPESEYCIKIAFALNGSESDYIAQGCFISPRKEEVSTAPIFLYHD